MNTVLFYNGLPSPDAVRAAMKRAGAIYPDPTAEARKAAVEAQIKFHAQRAKYQANYRKRQKNSIQ